MSLADYYDPNKKGGGNWLSAGEHLVTVSSCTRVDNPNTGNMGVEYYFLSADGCQQRDTFWLTKAAFWRLANFAAACGLTEREMLRMEPSQEIGWRMLLNRRVIIVVEPRKGKDGNMYNNVIDWKPASNAGPPPMAPPPQASLPPVPPVEAAAIDEDVPF